MWQNFLHRQQGIAEGITVFLGNLLNYQQLQVASSEGRPVQDLHAKQLHGKHHIPPASAPQIVVDRINCPLFVQYLRSPLRIHTDMKKIPSPARWHHQFAPRHHQ